MECQGLFMNVMSMRGGGGEDASYTKHGGTMIDFVFGDYYDDNCNSGWMYLHGCETFLASTPKFPCFACK